MKYEICNLPREEESWYVLTLKSTTEHVLALAYTVADGYHLILFFKDSGMPAICFICYNM